MTEKGYKYGELKNYEIIRHIASVMPHNIEIVDIMRAFNVSYNIATDRVESLTRLKLLRQTKKGLGNTHVSLWAATNKGRAYNF